MSRETEDLLRETFHDLAAAVPDSAATSYRKEQARWRRREYRRRCVVAVLVLLVVVVVCAIGLMMLSHASSRTDVIFHAMTCTSSLTPSLVSS
ncbi:hypothetical protein ABT127_29290 [Streptomyces sp. NPDC001904]|uniref:hypothetical protein n=1 Tax=Streptomyces sp. NPDC001904 TaxID=3154531 RepID=UPI00331F4C06